MSDIGRIGFLGCGNMAKALITGEKFSEIKILFMANASDRPMIWYLAGIVMSSIVRREDIIASKVTISSEEICHLTQNNAEVVLNSEIIVIAVKPALIPKVLGEIKEAVSAEILRTKLFISIAAGVSINDIELLLTPGVRIIRVMPNTPCSVRECASAYSTGQYASSIDRESCEAIFKSVGTVSSVPESLMDGVTGLSGSGPACKNFAKIFYFFWVERFLLRSLLSTSMQDKM